jgi:hypothetical protein
MRYLCLVFSEENDLGPQNEAEADALIEEHLAYDETLKQSGHYIIAQALQPGASSVTVRVRNSRLSVTDGPFAETKELTGFFLIEARDLNEAIQVAAKVPSARMGHVEVRPIWDLLNRPQAGQESETHS